MVQLRNGVEQFGLELMLALRVLRDGSVLNEDVDVSDHEEQ